MLRDSEVPWLDKSAPIYLSELSFRQVDILGIAWTDGNYTSMRDALFDAECVGLMRDDDDHVFGIYERAGFNGDTHVDSAMNNPCMLAAGYAMLSESDDNYNEVY